MNGCLGSRATPLQVNTATSFFITSQTTHCTNWTIHTNHPFINPITRLTIAVVRLLLKQHITILNATEQNFTKLVQITVTCSPHSHHIYTHPPTHSPTSAHRKYGNHNYQQHPTKSTSSIQLTHSHLILLLRCMHLPSHHLIETHGIINKILSRIH